MKLLMILIAVLVPPEINLVGRLMLADLGCFVVVVVALVAGKMPPLLPAHRTFYMLTFVWLFVQVMTDLYVGSDPADFLRGWARIVFFAINFTAVRIMTRNDIERAVFFLVLVLAAAAVKFYFGNGSLEKTGDLALDWKIGYGAAATAVLMYVGLEMARVIGTKLFGTIGATVAAALNLAMNARSLFGQTVFAALAGPLVSGRRGNRLGPATIALFAVLTVGGGYASFTLYSYTASAGLLGRDAQEKYERQADNDLGLLLSGRTELLGSLDAIADSPIVGYGAYARDMHYAELRYIRLKLAGVPVPSYIEDDRIPAHSILFGTWVEAGIFGALLWLWVLFATLRGMLLSLARPMLHSSLVVFAGTALVWDILFSPFGLDRRIVTPTMLNLMLVVSSYAAASIAPRLGRRRAEVPATPRRRPTSPPPPGTAPADGPSVARSP